MVDVLQGSFTGGELSPNLYSRVDLARWATSLKLCRSWVTTPWGGAKTRRGTRFCTRVKEDVKTKPVNILPFQFNSDQGYLLEMGHHYMRVLQNGAYIIVAAATAWAATTAYVVGDRVSSGLFNYRCNFAHTSGAVFASTDGWALESEIGEPYEIITPYSYDEVGALNYAQSADVMTIVHPSHAPYAVKRYGMTDWRIEPHALNSGPFEPINSDIGKTVWTNADTGLVTLSATQAIFTADRVGGLFYFGQDGFTQPWETAKTITLGEERRSDGKYYEATNAGTTGTLRPTHIDGVWSDGGVVWRYRNSGFGVARITDVAVDGKTCTAEVLTTLPKSAITSGYGATITLTGWGTSGTNLALVVSGGHGVVVGTDEPALVELVYTLDGSPMTLVEERTVRYVNATTLLMVGEEPPVDRVFVSGTVKFKGSTTIGASKVWAFGAWSLRNGYPSCVTYHQGRRCYAGAPGLPQTVWLSRSDVYDDFSVSSPLQEDDAQTVTLVSGEINPIKGLLSMGRLLVFTSGAYWTLGDGKTPIGASTLLPEIQSYVGASSLQPLGVAESALFVHDGGGVVSDVTYAFAEDKHISEDLNLSADHLTDGYTITGWAYQRRPFGIVWCVRSDGTLLGLTYNRRQVVAGWHRHDTKNGVFEAVAVVKENGLEVLYTLVNRTGIGRMIERFGDLQDSSLTTGVFTDSSLSYNAYDKSILTLRNNTYDHTDTRITIPVGTYDEEGLVLVTADGPLFYDDDLGAELRVLSGRRLTIEEIVSTTQARVRPDSQFTAPPYGGFARNWQLARKKFFIEHLQGGTVSALIDGSVELDLAVGAFGEVNTSQAGLRVTIGLPIEADLETLELASAQGETLVTKLKRIGKVSAQVVASRGLMAGRTFSTLETIKELMPTTYNQPPDPRTGIVSVTIPTSVSSNGSIAIRQKYPLPATITSLTPDVEVMS